MSSPKQFPSGLRVRRNDDGALDGLYACSKALKMQCLAHSFPSLRSSEGIDPWDVTRLVDSAYHVACSGSRQAILFVLSVWDPDAPELFGLPHFDVHDALRVWDFSHRQAFISWVQDPWWV